MAKENMKMEALSEQYLLRKNQIYLFGVIDTGMAARVIPQMHYIEQKMIEENLAEEDRVLTLLINSPGGSVSDGLAIYDTQYAGVQGPHHLRGTGGLYGRLPPFLRNQGDAPCAAQ